METIAQQKNTLRVELKRRRHAIEPAHRQLAEEAIARSAARFSQTGMRVGVYYASPHEAPTLSLVQALWAKECQVYLPCIQKDRLLAFRQWASDDILTRDNLGIPTPASTATAIGADQLDLLFMPLLGFDPTGRRLGMGGGYYDTTLSNALNATKIGLAFDCQEVECIPVEEHDIRLDILITESRVLRFQ